MDLKLELAEHTLEMIRRDGHGKAIAVQADVTNETDCKTVIETAKSHFGRLDILVNVVGVGGATGTAVDVNMVEWAKSA